MFRHILVPIDLSTRNTAALTTALQLAQQNRARVTLLHVVQRIEHVAVREVRGFYRRLEKAAQRKLHAASRRFAAKGVDVTPAVVLGAPAQEIVAHAATNDVDLIVLASHRIDPSPTGAGWGTTSYKVAVLCPCPVLLVK